MAKLFSPFAPFVWRLAHARSIELGPKSVIMGILNVTPDSFSDGGRYTDPGQAVAHAMRMAGEGAAIIDIGGESTRPGADPVPAEVELSRVLPVIRELVRRSGVAISIDTWRPETARIAIDAGAHIVNDVWGLQKEAGLGAEIAESNAGCVLMHTGRGRERDTDVFADQYAYLGRSLNLAESAGIDRQAIVLDPGFGFAKDPHENLQLLARFERLLDLGQPFLVGTSRKRFIGHVTGRDADQRDIGTVATHVVARLKGAAIFRVHDVASHRDALAMADAVLDARATVPDKGKKADEPS